MVAWSVDVIGFLLLCVGSKLAMPRIFRLLCRIAAFYVVIFTICYYLWLTPQFRTFKENPHLFPTGMSMAFGFQGFWSLLGNMVMVQAIFPVAVACVLFFGVKWPVTGPSATYRR